MSSSETLRTCATIQCFGTSPSHFTPESFIGGSTGNPAARAALLVDEVVDAGRLTVEVGDDGVLFG